MPYCRLPAWQGGEQPIIRIREEPAAPVFGLAGGCKTGGISRRNLRRGPKEGRLRGRRSPQYTFACRRIHVVAAIFRKPDAKNGQRAAGRRSGTMIKSRLIQFRPGGSISGSIPISLGYRDLTRGKGSNFTQHCPGRRAKFARSKAKSDLSVSTFYERSLISRNTLPDQSQRA